MIDLWLNRAHSVGKIVGGGAGLGPRCDEYRICLGRAPKTDLIKVCLSTWDFERGQCTTSLGLKNDNRCTDTPKISNTSVYIQLPVHHMSKISILKNMGFPLKVSLHSYGPALSQGGKIGTGVKRENTLP